ncbi:hypothetical protein [Streptomyces sp. NPDC000410]|uniref:hypothetical protein n=1 Tax=Streptomyces sp. NPDC000410 TaxID=3154254 RepID=UPI00331E5298
MLNRWFRRSLVAFAALMAALFVLPSQASASADGCKSGGGSHAVACLTISGGGTYVEWMYAKGYSYEYPSHIQLYGPPGSIGNGSEVPANQLSVFEWAPWSNVPGGDYCSRVWVRTSGTYYSVITKCWTVW